MFAATITPFNAPADEASIQPYTSPVREATRQRINTWIRESGKFDAVFDFDAVVRNQSVPAQLADAFNSGDFLHPNVAGYTAIANSIDLSVFEKFEAGVSGFQ